mmetsp:Transcript_32606/g.39011  ORF Transcript_32606/g.39011 Transcript_32606/m.39011 type:complete len:423 (-) Transcript_32606:204-1472(-)
MISQFIITRATNPNLTKRLLLTSITSTTTTITTHPFTSTTQTSLAAANNNNPPKSPTLPFRPRRRTPKQLQTPPPPKSTYFHNSDHHKDDTNINSTNHPTASALSYLKRAQDRLTTTNTTNTNTDDDTRRLTKATLTPSPEALLRAADYFSSEPGSTEDLILQRRAINLDAWNPEEGRRILRELDTAIDEETSQSWLNDPEGFTRWKAEGEPEYPEIAEAAARERDRWNSRGSSQDDEENTMEIEDMDAYDPNQRAFGAWSESVVAVDRVQKVMRGGTTVRYRALAIGGNLNGCAGYGIAKAHAPPEAVAAACRMTRRNIFFVDRYQNTGLTTNLVGKHNSCRVLLRAVGHDGGLRGNALGCEILKYFGITDCTVKSHGNRNDYNVVYATFKALLTHESMEDIALKRGKRLLNLERAKRLQI